MLRLLKITSFFFAIGFASCITDGESYSDSWSIADGAKLPEFQIATSEGHIFSSSDLADSVAVIVFFNTDCIDCRKELPEIQKAYEQTRESTAWIAIGRDQDKDKAANFWIENHLTIPYAPQQNRKIYSLFAAEGIPRLYIADNQVIVAQFAPEQLHGVDALINKLKEFTR
ncbi:MAG: TlpA family protein disulfide reductase [Muribaculaceae bacterium]|nr:TlpA family protein disulfide reductase [Muribaculaceae bacterium]